MNIGIIGLGAIGKTRLNALDKLKDNGYPIGNIYVSDPNVHGSMTLDEIKQEPLDFVIIATPHDVSLNILDQFSDRDIKILIEKPLGTRWWQTNRAYMKLKYPENVFVGFNYRFYDCIEKMFEHYFTGLFGEIYGINIELAHGGSPNDESTWKNDVNKVGYDSLIDPGVHALNLIYLMDSSVRPLCYTESNNDGVKKENNVLLKGDKIGIVNLQTSLVRWKNTFKFQINGDKVMGVVSGRGGHYGTQSYSLTRKWAWMSKETEMKQLQSDCTNSFYKELESILFGQKYFLYPCTAREALNNMELYENCLLSIEE